MARAAAKTTSIDRGLDAEARHVRMLNRRGVKVGMQAGQGAQDGVDLLDILIFNEFGTRYAPARPVMRTYFNSDLQHLEAEAGNAALFIARTGAIDSALARLGTDMQARLQKHWRASKGWAIPNSSYTIKAKGSDVPLIDHGVLINAVRYQVF